MPRARSVLKRQRQNLKRRFRNKAVRSGLRTHEKRARQSVGTDDESTAYREIQKRLDKAASKGVIHPNKAARKKSRLAKAQKSSST